MDTKDIDALSDKIAEFKERKEILSEQLKEVEKELASKEFLMVEALVEAGKSSWETPRGKFSVKTSTYWNILDNDKLVQYFQKNNPEMIKLHPTTIRGYFNSLADQIAAERGVTPDFAQECGVTNYTKRAITLRKNKGE